MVGVSAENKKRGREKDSWSLHDGLGHLSLDICDANDIEYHHILMRCH